MKTISFALKSPLLMEKLCFKNFMVDIKAVFASFAGSGAPNCAAARDAKSIKSRNENGCRAHYPALAGATTTFASWAKSRQWPSQRSHSYSAKIGVSSSWASGNNKSLIWEQHWFNECYGSKTKSKYQLRRFQENYRRYWNAAPCVKYFVNKERTPCVKYWKPGNIVF